MTPSVRVRFAPSPTGFLHVGGARTALFNWLFARSLGGQFFLRIEDTDLLRSTDDAIEAILDGMRWLGLDWDRWGESDPVRQTTRFARYRAEALRLLDSGLAYRCDCTAEALEGRRKEALAAGRPPRYDGRCRHRVVSPDAPSVVRFAAPVSGTIEIDDLVKGAVSFAADAVDDLILLRSDGTPTYNFCVVIDDADMEITHVIRGDDHLNNTPKQIQIYHALGRPVPHFAHLSMILGGDRARLSKRHGATAVQQYREEGYLPEAMVNYLVRLGWSHQDQELFTREEMVKAFSMDHVGASAAIFNPDKLLWINAHYIKTSDPERLAGLLLPHLERLGVSLKAVDPTHLSHILLALRERSRTLEEMAVSVACFFQDEVTPDETAQKVLTAAARPVIEQVRAALADIPFEHDPLAAALKGVGESLGLKLAQVAQPIRAAVTGKTVSPGIFDVLQCLGRAKVLARLDATLQKLPPQ